METTPVTEQKIEPETAPEPTTQPIQRRYKENITFFSDLFRLKVEKMLQWKGWTKISQNAPRDQSGNLNDDWVYTEHCHYFHTLDSNGRKQTHSQPVGQHMHKIDIVRDPNNPEDILEVKCVSGPLKWEITTQFGKRQKALVPDPHDNHTHETEYIKSNKLSHPDMNEEAAKVASRSQTMGTSKEVYDSEGKPLGRLDAR